MENIHPSHNPLSKSLMLWSNTNANFRYYHISLIMHMWKNINNISRYCGNHDLISPDHGKHPSESSGTLLVHLSESRARKKHCPISQVTSSRNFCCYRIFIWFYQADTASSPRCYCSISWINNRRFSSQNNPPTWTIHSLSRFTHTLPCLTLISTVRALVCATASPVRSPAKASAILNESITAVTASRFSPVT